MFSGREVRGIIGVLERVLENRTRRTVKFDAAICTRRRRCKDSTRVPSRGMRRGAEKIDGGVSSARL